MSEIETEGPTTRERAMAGYRTYSRLNWARRIWGWLTAGGAGNTAAGLGAAAVVAGAGAMVATDLNESRQADKRLSALVNVEIPATATRQDLGREAVVYAVRGRDSKGRLAEFDVIVLARDFHWVKGRSDQMERGGQTIDGATFQNTLTEKELGVRLSHATDLIAVGLASAEGERQQEETRATERAGHIAKALAGATRGSKTIWTLNLGQYTGKATDLGSDGSDWQRPILIIGLRSAAADVDLGEALASAMNGADNLPKTASYSRFELTKAN